MKSERQSIRTFVRKYWRRLALAVIITLAAGVYLQPFSARFEGRTIRQWIELNASSHHLPKRAAVEHFGASAVPVLLRESKPGGLFSVSISLERLFKTKGFDPLRSSDFDRRMACADWAQMLLATDPDIFARLIATTRDNHAALEMARLFFGEHHLRENLRALSRQKTNLTLQARAGELLQAYRDMI